MAQVKITRTHYDVTTSRQYRRGDVVDLDDAQARRMVKNKWAVPHGNNVETRPADDTEVETRGGKDWQSNYRAAQRRVKDLGLDIAGNASHEALIDAIEEAENGND